MCLMDCFQYWLVVDELQFGFRRGIGCRDAIFTVQGVIKAFDEMSHYGLYIKLMELSIPWCFIDILICWYGKCFGVVRYDNYLSSRFHVCAGVRQGGVLSPCVVFCFYELPSN